MLKRLLKDEIMTSGRHTIPTIPNFFLSKNLAKEVKINEIFDQVNYLFCVINPDGRIQKINQAWQKILGWPEHELTQENWLSLIHPDHRYAGLSKLKQSNFTAPITLEIPYRHRNGSYRWLSWHLFPQKHQLTYAFARDITHQKKSASSQPSSPDQFSKIPKKEEKAISPIWVALMDPKGQLIYSNMPSSTPSNTPKSPKSIEGSFIRAVHPYDRLATQQKLKKLLDASKDNDFTSQPVAFVNRYLTPDGSYQLLSWKATFLPRKQLIYATGHPLTLLSADEEKLIENLQEILERKEVEALPKSSITEVQTWLSTRQMYPGSDLTKELEAVRAELDEVKTELQQQIVRRQKAEADLNRVFNLSPDLLIVAAADRHFQKVNPAVETILGYTPAEFLSRPWLDFVHPDDREATLTKMASLLETPTSIDKGIENPVSVLYFENRYRHKDGSYRWLAWKSVFLVEEQVWYSSARDITQQKQLIEALQQSEEQYRQLANQERLLNQLTKDIRHSLNLETIIETAVNEIQGLLAVDRCAFVWYRHQGIGPNQPKWEIFQEAKSPHLPNLREPYPVLPEDALRQKLLKLQMVQANDVANSPDPLVRQLCQDWGCTSVIMLPIITPAWVMQPGGSDLGVLICGQWGEVRDWNDAEFELLQGVVCHLSVAIRQAELYSKAQEAARAAQEKAEQLQAAMRQLKKTQAHLIQTEKMSSLGLMVAGVAHEINNPISFIAGNINHAAEYTEQLLDLLQSYQRHYPKPLPEIQAQAEAIDLDFLQEDLPKIFQSMQMGSQRISEIVLSLRNFSRLDESPVKNVDIHGGIDATLMILQSRLKPKNGCPAITVKKDYGNLPTIDCYPAQLNQVFMNLLSNAIDSLEEKYAQQELADFPGKVTSVIDLPEIIIRTEVTNKIEKFLPNYQKAIAPNQSWVVIHIIDNGTGISPEIVKHIFDPFFTTKPVGKGTGLGLAISYQIIVEKHQGIIKCNSTPGKGTEFIIALPLGEK